MSVATSSSRICTGCFELIPTKRLIAKPNARLCVGCQSSQDVAYVDCPVDMSRLGRLAGDSHVPPIGLSCQERGLRSVAGNDDGYEAPVLKRLSSRGMLATSGLSAYMSNEAAA